MTVPSEAMSADSRRTIRRTRTSVRPRRAFQITNDMTQDVIATRDGRILVGLLPHRLSYALARVEPYGFFILIALLATNTLGFFLQPFYEFGVAIVRLFI